MPRPWGKAPVATAAQGQGSGWPPEYSRDPNSPPAGHHQLPRRRTHRHGRTAVLSGASADAGARPTHLQGPPTSACTRTQTGPRRALPGPAQHGAGQNQGRPGPGARVLQGVSDEGAGTERDPSGALRGARQCLADTGLSLRWARRMTEVHIPRHLFGQIVRRARGLSSVPNMRHALRRRHPWRTRGCYRHGSAAMPAVRLSGSFR